MKKYFVYKQDYIIQIFASFYEANLFIINNSHCREVDDEELYKFPSNVVNAFKELHTGVTFKVIEENENYDDLNYHPEFANGNRDYNYYDNYFDDDPIEEYWDNYWLEKELSFRFESINSIMNHYFNLKPSNFKADENKRWYLGIIKEKFYQNNLLMKVNDAN